MAFPPLVSAFGDISRSLETFPELAAAPGKGAGGGERGKKLPNPLRVPGRHRHRPTRGLPIPKSTQARLERVTSGSGDLQEPSLSLALCFPQVNEPALRPAGLYCNQLSSTDLLKTEADGAQVSKKLLSTSQVQRGVGRAPKIQLSRPCRGAALGTGQDFGRGQLRLTGLGPSLPPLALGDLRNPALLASLTEPRLAAPLRALLKSSC